MWRSGSLHCSAPCHLSVSLDRRSAPDHGGYRIAHILHPLRQAMGLDPHEAGMPEVALDEAHVAVIVKRPPNCHRLCPEAPVREADDERRTRTQQARNLAQYCDRLLQILDRNTDHRRIE